ncbi:MAG: Ig-like domain-containing protein, partial [Solirubrobacterales bacterium]
YWANFTEGVTPGAIGRADLDGTDPDDDWIPSPNASNPTNVAVDAGHVYWTNAGLPNSIGRANLNGTSPNRDFITGLSFLQGLAVDALSVPSCRGTSASTGHAEPVGVTLPCTSGGGARTFAIARQPAHGQISGLNAATGGLTYTPDAGFNGTDTFTYRASNPGATSNTATATIEVAASNEFEIGKAKKNKKKGTATLPVAVPGAGALELAGAKVKPVTAEASGAGEVDLRVKAAGKARKKLKTKGKAKVAAEVTYTPDGGDPNTESTSIKLKRKG